MAKATDSRIDLVVTTGGVDDDEKFAPSVWGDFFITYVPPMSQACKKHGFSLVRFSLLVFN
ncbi:hypothetical protein Q6247_25370, partial [Klebsiella pneumoniae]